MSATRVPDILFSPKVIIGSVGLCGPGFVHGARAGPGKAAISGATAVIITLLPRRVCEPHAMRRFSRRMHDPVAVFRFHTRCLLPEMPG